VSEPFDVIDGAGPFTASRGQQSVDAPADAERAIVAPGGDDVESLARTVEALLFLSTEPLSSEELAEATGAGEEELGAALELLAEQCAPGRRGIRLRELGGGWSRMDVLAPRLDGWLASDRYKDASWAGELIEALARSSIDAVVFTSAVQIHNLCAFAEKTARASPLADQLNRVVIASIGPVCSRALREHGITPTFEADPPKLGPLVAGLDQALSV